MHKGITFVVVWVIIIALIVFGVIFLLRDKEETIPAEEAIEEIVEEPLKTQLVIGASVEGRPIEVFRYGNGDKHLLFVGGIHGGYEWNSTLLSYAFIDYLDENPDFVPDNMTISVIPSANPDGLFKIIQKEGRFEAVDVPVDVEIALGRFNSNDVDLNRNFDCKWAPESTWRGNVVSAGTEAFSEPEAIAIRDFVASNTPDTVVFWHSKANAVYASECEEGVLPETLGVMNTYSTASGYKPVPVFDAYEITGDAEGWLASIGIPAVTVELETRESIEWARNLAGVTALVNSYTQE